MNRKNGDTTVTVIIIIVVILIIIASYFMFFRNKSDDNANNLDNTNTNNELNIYDNNSVSDDIADGVNILDANAKEFYERVKKGITLDGKLIEVPAKYMTRLINKIGVEGYKLGNDAKTTVNSKLDEIEKTLADNNVSDINDLDSKTKDKIDELINDIEEAL